MKQFIVQVRIGPNEFFLQLECKDIGDAILRSYEYLMDLNPNAIYEIYLVQQSDLNIALEDLILN